MKKNIIYLIIFLVLLIVSYFLVFRDKLSTLGQKDTDFAIEDTSEVYKIFMADMKGNKILLEKNNSVWMLNKKYNAREDAIQTLLTTFNKIRIAYPVPKSAHNTVVADLASNNIKAEIYNNNGKKIKTYYIGGPTLDYKGTFMMLEGSEHPYVIHIPGFEGYMTPRFFLEEEEWKDRAIFNYTADLLKSVTVDYLEEPENSFTITIIYQDSIQIAPLYFSGVALGELHKNRLKEYLSHYNSIYAEAFENNNPIKDSILATSPFIIMTAINKNGNKNTLKIYRMPMNERSKSKFDDEGKPRKYDLDRLYALHNDNEFMLIQYYVFNKLFRSYREFFQGIEKNK